MVPYMEPLKSYEEGSAVQVGVKVEGGFSLLQMPVAVKIQKYKYTNTQKLK